MTNDPGMLKLTVRKFYRASGSSTQLKGVTPDIVLPSPNNVLEVGEAAAENPLPWDTIESAKFDRLNRVEPYLAELRKRSDKRVAAAKDFDYAREDMELVKKQQADKTVSLNENQRLKEKEEADVREKARNQERLARQEPEQKVYDLTLKLADLPGLPPPTAKTNAVVARSEKKLKNSETSKAPGVTAPSVSTNSASVATSASPTPKTGEVASVEKEEKAPPIDITLEETEHILVDYLSLLSKDSSPGLAADSAVRK
jgi:carboxyl-terminal processing protease